MTNIRLLGKNERLPEDLLLLADESLEAINKYISNCEIYVFEVNNKIIAEYALQQINEMEVEIKNIAVTPEFQNKGIGKALLRDASDRAKASGFKTISIGTGDAAIRLLRLYQNEGFKKMEVRKKFFIDNFPKPIFENGIQLIDMIVLKKELK